MCHTNFVVMEGGELPELSIFTKNEEVASIDPGLVRRHLGNRQNTTAVMLVEGSAKRGVIELR